MGDGGIGETNIRRRSKSNNAKDSESQAAIPMMREMHRCKFWLFLLALLLAILACLNYIAYETSFVPRMVVEFRYNYLARGSSLMPLMTFKYRGKPNVISYCVYGPRAQEYFQGLPEIVAQKENSTFFRGWKIWIYHDGYLSNHSMEAFRKSVRFIGVDDLDFGGIKVARVFGMLWRFLPMASLEVDVFCSRDLDSGLIQRDADAVFAWLNGTNKLFHIMRDNSVHTTEILGGMWCYRNYENRALGISLVRTMLREGHKKMLKGFDQELLRNIIYPVARENSLQHDSYHCKRYRGSKPFPTRRLNNLGFVGCSGSFEACHVNVMPPCPLECRPPDHQDWVTC